jgi:hypothetical protein
MPCAHGGLLAGHALASAWLSCHAEHTLWHSTLQPETCTFCLQDKRFSYDEWPGIKPSMPFQQVPVLQLEDGQMLAQMAAIGEHSVQQPLASHLCNPML